MLRMNQRILLIFIGLSLFTLTSCGKDSPTEPELPESPPPPPIPSRIVITPSSVTLDAIGQTGQLTAQVFDQNNALMSSAVVTWTGSDDAVATVSTAGLVTGVGNGSASITARSGGSSASVNVTVMQTAHGIAIEPQTATLTAIGETMQLTATVLDRNEQPVAGVAVSWTSSDTGVATVDDEGLVTALSSGEVRITASHGGISDTVQIKVDIASPDRGTLITLYNALDGPNWTHSANWLSNRLLGTWHGVETDDNGRVTSLSLSDNNLSGSIPPELGNLTNLQELDLHENAQLSCSIPPELGNLTNLRRLSLFSTPFLPAIFPPSWDPVPNPLCSIPAELGNLTNLQELRLGLHDLSGGIPPELGNLTNLQRLDLSFNALSGSIPSELGNLANLYWLDLSINALSGSIPSKLGNLANLQILNLNLNGLFGGIPPELGNLSNLQALELGFNRLSGGIPPELGNLANLKALELGFNRLSGSVPPELGNLSELTHLSLSYNEDLTGPLPDTFTSLDNLQWLILDSTGLCVPSDAAFQTWLEHILVAPEEVYCEAM